MGYDTDDTTSYIVEAEPNYSTHLLARVHNTIADIATHSDVYRTTFDADRNGIYHVTVTAERFPRQLREHVRRNELSIKTITIAETIPDAIYFVFRIPNVRGEPYEGTHEGPELGSGLED